MTGSTAYRGSMHFTCGYGYNLVGAKTISCQADVTWGGRVPTCKATCRAGYQLIAQTCIRVGLEEKDYEDAQADCEREGATLAMPKTKELDVALRNVIVNKYGKDSKYWIGLKESGSWLWADGSSLDDHDHHYQGWNPGEPASGIKAWFESSDCVQYWSGPTDTPMWDDTACGYNLRYICQES
ncbi:brevican core protein-like [Branchiostoma floridae]|uniref:Brevican core protein-like n=1 Tax=Branchiostoma floridae TaxID=7739 RepID=A0A9J7KJK4_BRAFL|nr:brevican core protein-like [Branchiostoma floridae]